MLLVTRIRPMTAEDWPRVEAIFAAGITGGEATFETVTPSWEQFDASKIAEARLVAVDDTGTVVGWVAASRVSAREVYRGVIEHSVYVDPPARRQGIGRLLLDAFVTAADEAGYWAIQSSVFPENTTSLNLHARADRPLPARRVMPVPMTTTATMMRTSSVTVVLFRESQPSALTNRGSIRAGAASVAMIGTATVDAAITV